MYEFLISLYIIVNVFIIVRYIKKWKMAAFMPPFIMAAISLTVLLPQLTSIYFLPKYDNNLLANLCFTIITCNIAFAVGFERGQRKSIPSSLLDIRIEKCKFHILAFSIIGLLVNVVNVDGVISALLRGFSQISLILAICYFAQVRRFNKVVALSFVVSILNILNYIFFIYGSRGSSLFLFICLLFSLTLFYKKYIGYINILLITFFLGGTIVSASISAFRDNLVKGENHKISYIDNFINSYKNSDSEVGMDLGNAAVLIEYCDKNNTYDYGTVIWNSFVFNFIPERVFGEGIKRKLQYEAGYENMIKSTTFSITTVTGYFEAFAALKYCGFLLFLAIGYLFGLIWSRAFYSQFYLLLLLYSLGNTPMLFTHNLNYVLSRWEYILIFILPMISMYLVKRRIS